MRPSWVEVDLGAIAHNVAILRDLVAPAALCAVVKADGYGHGDLPVAEAALAAGADWLAVALVEEGIRLREGGIEAPVLILSEPPVEDAPLLIEWGLTPTVYQAGMLSALGHLARYPLDVHLKVDTGMHRVGSPPPMALELARQISRSPSLRLGAVWSHLAVADEDPVFTAEQIRRFEEFCRGLAEEGIGAPMRHLANTAGALLFPAARYDMVRLGLGVYGLHPAGATRSVVALRPAMRVLSHVTYLQHHPAGTRPSYGRRRPLAAGGQVATVPIGYADGLPRLLSSRGGEVAIRGRRYPLAGTVTMDQIMVEVGDDPVVLGDEVVVLGGPIGADEWAQRLETISYEVVCQISPRLPRRYLP